MTKFLYVDTACAAFPQRNVDWHPHCVRIATIFEDTETDQTWSACHLIRPLPGWGPSTGAFSYHLATDRDFQDGCTMRLVVADELEGFINRAHCVVSHNAQFHNKMVASIFKDADMIAPTPPGLASFCTMTQSMPALKLPTKNDSGYKQPKLAEAFKHFSGTDIPIHTTWQPHGLTQVKAVRVIHRGLMGL
jgi:DNA polymerase-3 subunit epsilon